MIRQKVIFPDGSIRWQRWVDRAIYNDAGVLTEYQSVGRDITDVITAELALEKSEQRYRNVVEDQTEFICRFLPDGTDVFVNGTYCRYFHKTRDEIIGHRFRPTIPSEDREHLKKFFETLTPDHPVDVIEHRIIMSDGEIRWQRWTDRAIFDQKGRIAEYQSVGQDITEEKEIEKEMEFHEKELRNFSMSLALANKKFNLLSSITRHDINNQLDGSAGVSQSSQIGDAGSRTQRGF